MNEKLKNINQFIANWYKTFGIDHVFHKIDFKSEIFNNQDTKKDHNKDHNKDHKDQNIEYKDLESLKNAILKIDCNLKKMARNTVFSDGNPNSDIMIIGEAPGNDEDIQGKPFVGQSGQLLNNMLLSVGIKRSDIYISNIVFWRPPGNRTPSSDEISLCMPYVENHIKLIKPKVLLLLGGVAVKSILNTNESISSLRGKKNKYNNIDTIASFHPAYLLRSPYQKSLAFRDFIELKKMISK